MSEERSGRRGSRRAARVAMRALPPAVNPRAPGQRGGQYRPLSDSDLRRVVYSTASRLLSELGVGEVPDVMVKPFAAAGAHFGDGRVYFSAMLVERIIGMAAKTFTFHGRDPARSIHVGGDSVHFGTGGAAVQTLDIDPWAYRSSIRRDLYDFTRLQDTLTIFSWFAHCCVATDMADPSDMDIDTVFALLKGATKPVAPSFVVAEHVAPVMRLVDTALGGDGTGTDRFRATPFLKARISPLISPLHFSEDAVMVTLACIEYGLPLPSITAAQSGAPATLAGFMAHSLTETLASLIMVNVIKPGHPMVFSNWPLVLDLRTGFFVGGGKAISVMNAASAQLSNWLGLPSGVASSMTEAKAIDAQYRMGKAISSLAAGLARGNLIYGFSGMMASLLCASFEAFTLDDEMHSPIYRTLRGAEVNKETLGFDAIRKAVIGPGHFLGGAHTIAAMQRDYFYPRTADRDAPVTWDEKGRPDAWGRARALVRLVLANPTPHTCRPTREPASGARSTSIWNRKAWPTAYHKQTSR